ncbi:MAG: sulfatase, partial [Bacteroides sp.]|nr:sulfatase [Bacteroides sp.]
MVRNSLSRCFIISISAVLIMMIFQACKPEPKPNFVWIISEDNSTHYMELFDPNGIATPNIERMAETGLVFTRAFSNAPVCSVARSTLESSCYGPRTGTQFHRKSTMVPMPDGVEMFPAYLRAAGYYTTNNSKEDYNYIKGEGVWDESSGKADWRKREANQPFFHKESHGISHESKLHFPAELMDTYSPVTDPDSVFIFPEHPDTELFRFTSAYYRDKILGVDSIVGRVLKKLEEDGLLESTFVFYFGDHGGVLPGSKGYAYETGLHVPLVVRIPENFKHLVNLRPGSECEGFVSFVDFGPTLLDLAGLDIPAGVDGIPFLGEEVSSQELYQRDITYGYADRFDEKYDLVRTVRKGRLKYIRNYQPFNFDGLQNNYRYKCLAYEQWRQMFLKGQLNRVQSRFFEAREAEALYDLDSDPYETRNLAGDPEYDEHLVEMRGLLSDWVKGMPDLSIFPESVLRGKAFGHPVQFGKEHQGEISRLVDLADLSLLPYKEAREPLGSVLKSDDPLELYWGMIVCSCF